MQRRKQKTARPKGQPKNLIPRGNLLPRRTDSTIGRTLNFSRDLGKVTSMDISIQPLVLVAASGNIANSSDIGNVQALAPNWSTSYANIWREYRVIGLRWYARVTSATGSGGEIWFWMDERSSGTPSSTDAQRAVKATLPATLNQGAEGSVVSGTWTADDLSDLNFLATTTPFSPVFLKQYAAPAVTGTNAGFGGSYLITTMVRVQFRDQI